VNQALVPSALDAAPKHGQLTSPPQFSWVGLSAEVKPVGVALPPSVATVFFVTSVLGGGIAQAAQLQAILRRAGRYLDVVLACVGVGDIRQQLALRSVKGIGARVSAVGGAGAGAGAGAGLKRKVSSCTLELSLLPPGGRTHMSTLLPFLRG
jgi:hypothetical protein